MRGDRGLLKNGRILSICTIKCVTWRLGVPDVDLFAFYRRVLVILGGTYGLIKLVQFVWRWREDSLSAQRSEALLRRWVEVAVLRIRMRRFTWQALQITGLGGILAYVVWLQLGGLWR